MKKLEVFFDFNCPYCLKGHEQLIEFMRDKAGLEIIWQPCEISEYKNNLAGLQPDISIQAMFFAMENNVDLWRFSQKVYDMKFTNKVNTADIEVFVAGLEGIVDAEALRQALKNGKYADSVKKSNRFAFKDTGVDVVPTYRVDGTVLQDRQEFYNMGPSDTAYKGRK